MLKNVFQRSMQLGHFILIDSRTSIVIHGPISHDVDRAIRKINQHVHIVWKRNLFFKKKYKSTILELAFHVQPPKPIDHIA